MGDLFQTLVATAVEDSRARELAERLRSWLIEEAIVVAETSDCVLGGSGTGHRPGLNFRTAVELDDEFLLRLATNGVDLEVGRVVAVDPQGENFWQCGSCHHWNEDGGSLMGAIGDWYEGNATARLVCSACSRSTLLTSVVSRPPIAVGHLGVTFWNWPPLSESFVSRVRERVAGPVGLVQGKL